MKLNLLLALSAASLAVVGCGKNTPAATAQLQSGTGIIGGEAATDSDSFSKSVVAVYDTKVGGLCTGTILSKNLIVTAGHCAQSSPADLKVIFGLNIESDTRKIMTVEALQVNPGYAKTMAKLEQIIVDMVTEARKLDPTFNAKAPSDEFLNQLTAAQENVKDWGDIALLKLNGTIPEGYIPTEILPSKSLIRNHSSILLAGYGITHPQVHSLMEFSSRTPRMDVAVYQGQAADALILRKVSVPVKDNAFSPSEVLLDQTKGKGACHGDSGGPAFSEVNGKLYVWGVTSRGIQDPTDSCGTYSAYTDMVDHREWIAQTALTLGADL